MKCFFPRFIRKNPTFYGLGFEDLGIFVIALLFATIAEAPLAGLVLSLAALILKKTIFKNVDAVGLLLSVASKKTISWKK